MNTGAALMMSCIAGAKQPRVKYEPTSKKPEEKPVVTSRPSSSAEQHGSPPEVTNAAEEEEKNCMRELDTGYFRIERCNEKYLESEEAKTFFQGEGYDERVIRRGGETKMSCTSRAMLVTVQSVTKKEIELRASNIAGQMEQTVQDFAERFHEALKAFQDQEEAEVIMPAEPPQSSLTPQLIMKIKEMIALLQDEDDNIIQRVEKISSPTPLLRFIQQCCKHKEPKDIANDKNLTEHE